MPLLGAHMSIAGGYHYALDAAKKYDCDTVQIFTKNNTQWLGKAMLQEDIDQFRQKLTAFELRLPMAHDSYLINLASPAPALYRQSVDAFVIEMQRAEALGLPYLVTHPGTPTDGDVQAGIRRIAGALDEIHQRCPRFKVNVLLETTAGQGKSVGHRFEDLASILDLVKRPQRIGICLDTCHVFAAGYALTPAKNYEATFAEFDRIIGLQKLKAFHVNDSLKPLGSRVDRHAAIGQGCLGLEPFRLLMNDPRFQGHPMVMETPKEGPNGEEMDPVNLATLRSLIGLKRLPKGAFRLAASLGGARETALAQGSRLNDLWQPPIENLYHL